jgi:hypothetical protein
MRIKLLRILYTLTQALSVADCIQTSCRDAALQIRRHAILQSVALPLLLTKFAFHVATNLALQLGVLPLTTLPHSPAEVPPWILVLSPILLLLVKRFHPPVLAWSLRQIPKLQRQQAC